VTCKRCPRLLPPGRKRICARCRANASTNKRRHRKAREKKRAEIAAYRAGVISTHCAICGTKIERPNINKKTCGAPDCIRRRSVKKICAWHKKQRVWAKARGICTKCYKRPQQPPSAATKRKRTLCVTCGKQRAVREARYLASQEEKRLAQEAVMRAADRNVEELRAAAQRRLAQLERTARIDRGIESPPPAMGEAIET
jgi:hypothetical protein